MSNGTLERIKNAIRAFKAFKGSRCISGRTSSQFEAMLACWLVCFPTICPTGPIEAFKKCNLSLLKGHISGRTPSQFGWWVCCWHKEDIVLVRTFSQDYLACVTIAPSFPLLLFCPILLSTVLSTGTVLSMIDRDSVLRTCSKRLFSWEGSYRCGQIQ